MKMNNATRAQVEAARPDASTWLSANAGSGKTRVLTDRVARLLLQGVEPQHILCLTYTKAAASEMQNRLFKRLGAWAMLPEADLTKALEELGTEQGFDPDGLRHARTLFARAIETPGGLKIQTIHSFCAALLRRFPLEAGVSPQFTEIEDRAADLLRAEIVDTMAAGEEAPLIAGIARYYTGEDFGKLTRDIVQTREHFVEMQDIGTFLDALGHQETLNPNTLEAEVFDGEEAALIRRVLPHLHAKGGNDGRDAKILESLKIFNLADLPLLEKVFLTGKTAAEPYTAKIGKFPTKATQAVIAADLPALEAFMTRVEAAREKRLALASAERSAALHRFAHTFVKRYEAAKLQRGWLDFDDLILKTRALLTVKAVAAWVLYRIDGGIDHILVDEAQDTSPAQWDVIEKLTDEFHSGSGARPDVERTLFVVGDKKQSIYSFQGADPSKFDEKSTDFADKIRSTGKVFQHRELAYSFRSSSAIMRFVDTVFDPRRRPGFNTESQHKAFKEALPGHVDLWPIIPPAEQEEESAWTDPLDRRSAQHHNVILAEKIAAQIVELTQNEHYIPVDAQKPGNVARRRIQPGDFLILVQSRSTLFSEIIRACKTANLPIAGADRLKVGAELAVKDLAALLSFLATPEDSLSLATALKSPLFGWSEQDLFTLAHRRTERHLWQALRDQERAYPETLEILFDLMGQVDFLRPYDLIERILTRHGGRKRLLARLGAEAEDGINAMLVQALAYERNDVPSLTGFLSWMQTDDLEIKRQVDAASNQIRVMTVHGAKGLEAPIVILPDTDQRKSNAGGDILETDGQAHWRPSADMMPQALRQQMDSAKIAESAERLRLLYVAITRAEKWLIFAGAGKVSKNGEAWYRIAEEAMAHLNAVPISEDGTLRFQEGDWNAPPLLGVVKKIAETPMLEPLFKAEAAPHSPQSTVLSPSDLGGAKALASAAGEESEAAMVYGSMVHELLENLADVPLADQDTMAYRMSVGNEDAAKEALKILNTPELSHLFDESTLAEVPITADVGDKRLHGVIDRLVIKDRSILAVDFKTNRAVPAQPTDCPEGILRQMGAYAEMLQAVYPGYDIKTSVLWTAQARLMALPHDLVIAALGRAPDLDGVWRPSYVRSET